MGPLASEVRASKVRLVATRVHEPRDCPPDATPVPLHLSSHTDKPELTSCTLTDLCTSLCQDIHQLRRAPAPARLDYIGRKGSDGVEGTCSLLRGRQRSVDACAQILTCARSHIAGTRASVRETFSDNAPTWGACLKHDATDLQFESRVHCSSGWKYKGKIGTFCGIEKNLTLPIRLVELFRWQ